MTDLPECDFCYERVTERGRVDIHDDDNVLTFCDWWCLKTWVIENCGRTVL